MKLHCLGGSPVPAGVAEDLRGILALPTPVQERLWAVLGPSLPDPVPPSAGAEVARFCQAHGVREVDLAPSMRACRFLVRQAAAEDLSPALFLEDLMTLTGERRIGDMLMAGYDAAKKLVRGEIVRRSLLDHGKLLEGVEWRLDSVLASGQGKNLHVPVVVMTLSYREGERSDRVTLQLLPETLQNLREMLERIAP